MTYHIFFSEILSPMQGRNIFHFSQTHLLLLRIYEMFVSLSFKEKIKFTKNIDANEKHTKEERDDHVFELMLIVVVYTTIIICK